ncbi:MAG: glucosaminidase domain-containing protein [Bacillus sp. (in: Bacteria)]|nr:glucosaminidase domain-containing protein [Bacillus sp. (in: firmicutes)]
MIHYRSYVYTMIIVFIIVLLFAQNDSTLADDSVKKFFPTPHEHTEEGRNTNVYLPLVEGPTENDQRSFIDEVSLHALTAQEKWRIPAAAIIGMAALESGYGTTRIAYYANNLFGIKVWGGNSKSAWQLQGQPDEDFDQAIPVLADYGEDRIVFDESARRDNWYRKFDSYGHSVEYLAGTLLVNDRYVFARDSFQQRLEEGWSEKEATKQYLYDIADAGYNHLGGSYYREAVGRLIDQWDLLQVQSYNSQTLLDLESSVDENTLEKNNRPLIELEMELLQKRKEKILLVQENVKVVEEENASSGILTKLRQLFLG